MSHLTRGDADLHCDDESHRSTSPSSDGHMVEQYERRLRRHLEQHIIMTEADNWSIAT